MSIGERIIELRKLSGMSQTELASAMEVSRQAVSKWETDQSSPEASKLILLAQILDTDIEYLTTGRRTYGRRPPVIIKTQETVEKIVEKPVVQIVEKVVETIVEKPTVQYVERPVVQKVYRTKFVRKPSEFIIIALLSFCLGLAVGLLL